MRAEGAKRSVRRAFVLLYLAALIIFLTLASLGYAHVIQGYESLWAGAPWLNPLSDGLYNPLLLLGCREGGSELTMRFLRTYAMPGAEELSIVVELQLAGGEILRMEARRRVVLGEAFSISFPLGFSIERLVGYRVEAHLNGVLVLAVERVRG